MLTQHSLGRADVNKCGFTKSSIAAVAATVSMAGATAAQTDTLGSKDPIRLALNEWTGQQITTYIAGETLKRLGYNVEYVTAGYIPQFSGLKTGDITATLEIWQFSGGDAQAEAIAESKVVPLGDTGVVTKEGLFYPAFVEKICPGLPDWKAMRDCSAALAAPDTLPKGRVLGWPSDWKSMSSARLTGFKLDDIYTNIPAGSEGALIAELRAAVARQRPIFAEFWQPHWLFSEPGVELKWVDFGKPEINCDKDPKLGVFPDTVNDCGWPSGWVRKFAWAGTKEKWPTAFEFLKVYQIDNDVQQPLMKAVDVDKQDLKTAVNAWLDKNEAVWKGGMAASYLRTFRNRRCRALYSKFTIGNSSTFSTTTARAFPITWTT
jgi:glycine betaine/proline transport system substrate-binding protein